MKTTIANLKQCGKQANGVYIGRSACRQFHFGNPFVIGVDGGRDEVCDKFETWLRGEDHHHIEPERREWVLANMHSMRGKVLMCFCAPARCHGETYIKLLEEQNP